MYQALLYLSLMIPGGEPCPCPDANVCVREPVVTKVKHVCYCSKCTEFCLGHDSFIRALLSGTGCDCCHVHRKHELIKKVCVEEKCEMKCVLHPGCATCAPCAPCAPGAPGIPPVTLVLPGMPAPSK